MQKLPSNTHSAEGIFEQVEELKFKIIVRVAIFAAAIHAALIPGFYVIGATPLAILNIFSTLSWLLGIWLIKNNRQSWGLRVVSVEVVVHSITACAFMGTETGFQFYLWSVSCILMVDYKMRMGSAVGFSLTLIAIFAAIYILFSGVAYPYAYGEFLRYIEVANILVAGVPMIYTLALIRRITLEQRSTLADMAAKDFLTGLYNRRFAKELMLKLHNRCSTAEQPMCVAIGDIDYFKQINDQYGHEVGDKVLVALSQTLLEHTRASDVVARWGGEEFIIALPNIDIDTASARIESIRSAIKSMDARQVSPELSLTMSFGLSQWQPQQSVEDVINVADDALYRSKSNGRDQTTLATSAPVTLTQVT
ncbi:GGDEF domain-containing protein [Pseudoalteromonas ruthenica]|uniref:GGDEF domain-containing protein n=1 Tax=Pseudoalteromonas ruthenica TaxID=151081 RepID=UPI0020168CB3|nr:GGDEF domain-containing protein [Pseudoalteromonas ruthenica]